MYIFWFNFKLKVWKEFYIFIWDFFQLIQEVIKYRRNKATEKRKTKD